MSLKNIKEYTDTLPKHLLHSLCSANIKDSDVTSIQQKLQERTSTSILSYLQLALIKLQQTRIAADAFASRIAAQEERAAFGAVLQQRVDSFANL